MSNSLSFKKKILLLKIESTEKTDAVPTGALNAFLTNGLTITPIETTEVDSDHDKGTMGNSLKYLVGSHVKCSFEIELATGGALGVLPAYAPALQICGMSVTETAATDVKIACASGGFDSATLYINIDGQLHPMVGARGSWSLAMSPQGIPRIKCDIIGLWVDPSSVPAPVVDKSMWKVPLPVDYHNTPTLTLHGGTYPISDFSYDHANDVKYRNVINDECVFISDRSPSGSVTLDAPKLSDKNWFTSIKAHEVGAVQVVHGSTAGNIIQIDMPVVQMTSPSYTDSDGAVGLQMTMNPMPTDAGDDEILITLK